MSSVASESAIPITAKAVLTDSKLPFVTPVTPALAKSARVGVVVALVPSYLLILSIAF